MNKDLHVNVNLEENRKALELRTDHKYTRNEKNRHTSTIIGIQNHMGMDIFYMYNCTILKKNGIFTITVQFLALLFKGQVTEQTSVKWSTLLITKSCYKSDSWHVYIHE